MTIKREQKTRVQIARTSTEPVRCVSPRQLATYGRYLPLEIGQRFNVECTRRTRTSNRTRAQVVAEKVTARRRARWTATLIAS